MKQELILLGRYYKERLTNFFVVVTHIDVKNKSATVLYSDGSAETIPADTFRENFELLENEQSKDYVSFISHMNDLERAYNS